MDLWFGMALIPICLAGGILLLRIGRKNGKKSLQIAGGILLAVFAACLLYFVAAMLLLGGID